MKLTGQVYLLLCSLAYAIFVVVTKLALNGGTDFWSFLASLSLVVIIVAAICFGCAHKRTRKLTKKHWIYLIIFAFLTTFMGRTITVIGVNYTTATNVGFLVKLSALTVIPFAYFMLGEKVKRTAYLAAAIMLAGVYLLTTGGALLRPALGDLMIIGLAILIGFSNSLAKKLMSHMSSYFVALGRILFGSIMVILLVLALKGTNTFGAFSSGLWYVLIAGICATLFSIFLYKGIDLMGAAKATIFMLISAIFTYVLAFTFLDEKLSAIKLLGGVAILAGAYLLTKK